MQVISKRLITQHHCRVFIIALTLKEAQQCADLNEVFANDWIHIQSVNQLQGIEGATAWLAGRWYQIAAIQNIINLLLQKFATIMAGDLHTRLDINYRYLLRKEK